MNDLLEQLGTSWLWVAGIILFFIIVWAVLKATHENNPKRKKPEASSREVTQKPPMSGNTHEREPDGQRLKT
jgi:flagellar biosynthesis/type III secretory pathway M-ring protein FliF/YscJ